MIDEYFKNIKKNLTWFENIFFYQSILSTNDKAFSLSKKFTQGRFAVIALRQTKGKGRLGRSWLSPKGNIYLSFALAQHDLPTNLNFLSIKFAVCIAQMLRDLGVNAAIKWPNDVVIKKNDHFLNYFGEYRKLGGILTETSFKAGFAEFVVVGIGLNVIYNQKIKDLVPHAAFLNEFSEISYENILTNLLLAIDQTIAEQNNDAVTLEKYKRLCITLGKNVVISQNGEKRVYLATSIDDFGALVVKNNEKVLHINFGEVNFITCDN